jgi:hypothetical protein
MLWPSQQYLHARLVMRNKPPTLRRQTRTSTAGAIQRYRVWANRTFSYHDRLDWD